MKSFRLIVKRLRLRCWLVLLLTALFCTCADHQTEAQTSVTLIPVGAIWKYRDNGSDQGTAWRAVNFNDSNWPSGGAELGYGDGDETTVVSYGPDAANKFTTTYFRHSFNVVNPSAMTALRLRVKRDDGVVVYLNGTEIFRENMPAGTVSFNTLASSSASDDGNSFLEASLSPARLTSGTNVLAAEIHQHSQDSSDISFDLELVGFTAAPASLRRGPYLQMGTSTGVTLRWRTSLPTDSQIRLGSTPTNLSVAASDQTPKTEHRIRLTSLTPNTRYYYSVGSSAGTLAGADANHFFFTSPGLTDQKAIRIWAIGDFGWANTGQAQVRDAYFNFAGTRYTDVWLMLGDNAYNEGLDTEYQTGVFDVYPKLLRQTVAWPTIGNHDTAQSADPPASLPYYSIFDLPMNAEAGGLASGTEDYYSFDYGNVHFVCLDSMTSARTPGSAMLTWLQNDLAANTKDWLIAYWHHPPYTKGSHDSDSETELTQMRQHVLPILEAWGVDLVLTGHSHSYERSFLIDGHYGTSSTFNGSMKKNGGDGRETGNGAYAKFNRGPSSNQGAVYSVVGSSGITGGGVLNHPAMFISLDQLGSMVIDVGGNRLDAKFLRETGAIGDSFTLVKGFVANAPANLKAVKTSQLSIDLTWTDTAINEEGYRIERSIDGVGFFEIATVAANVTAFSDTKLLPRNRGYFYRVRAFRANELSPYSNITEPILIERPGVIRRGTQ